MPGNGTGPRRAPVATFYVSSSRVALKAEQDTRRRRIPARARGSQQLPQLAAELHVVAGAVIVHATAVLAEPSVRKPSGFPRGSAELSAELTDAALCSLWPKPGKVKLSRYARHRFFPWAAPNLCPWLFRPVICPLNKPDGPFGPVAPVAAREALEASYQAMAGQLQWQAWRGADERSLTGTMVVRAGGFRMSAV